MFQKVRNSNTLPSSFLFLAFQLLQRFDLIFSNGGGCYLSLIVEEDVDQRLIHIGLNRIYVGITTNPKKWTSFKYVFQNQMGCPTHRNLRFFQSTLHPI